MLQLTQSMPLSTVLGAMSMQITQRILAHSYRQLLIRSEHFKLLGLRCQLLSILSTPKKVST